MKSGAGTVKVRSVVSSSPDSKELAKELKRRGFVFVGPTTVYSTMQAVGVVNDHLAGCFVRDEVEAARRDVSDCEQTAIISNVPDSAIAAA